MVLTLFLTPSLFLFLFFSPSACLICQGGSRKRFFYFSYETPSGGVWRKTRMTFLFSASPATWWMEVFKKPDYFCRTVHLSGSQLAVSREAFVNRVDDALKGKCVGGPVEIGGYVCLCMCVGLCICGASLLCLHVWCKWSVVWRRAQCDAPHGHEWLHSEPGLLWRDRESQK